MHSFQKAVGDLYTFRDHYFENHALEEAINKADNIQKQLDNTVELFENYKGRFFN